MCTELFLRNFQRFSSSHTSFYVQVQYNSLSSYTKHFFIHRFYSYIEQLYCNFLTYRVKVKHDRTQNVLLKTNRKADIPCFTKSRIVTPPPPNKIPFCFNKISYIVTACVSIALLLKVAVYLLYQSYVKGRSIDEYVFMV